MARVPFGESRAGTERDSEHQGGPRGKADGTFGGAPTQAPEGEQGPGEDLAGILCDK